MTSPPDRLAIATAIRRFGVVFAITMWPRSDPFRRSWATYVSRSFLWSWGDVKRRHLSHVGTQAPGRGTRDAGRGGGSADLEADADEVDRERELRVVGTLNDASEVELADADDFSE